MKKEWEKKMAPHIVNYGSQPIQFHCSVIDRVINKDQATNTQDKLKQTSPQQ